MILKDKAVNLKNILGYIFFVEVPAERKRKYVGRLPLILLSISTGILYFIFSIFLTTSLGFILGITITKYHIIASTILSVGVFHVHLKKINGDNQPIRFVALILLIFIFIWISLEAGGMYYDLSYDGQTYHQEAIIALSGGWNPVYDELTRESHPEISYQKLLNSYPKASEIIEAVIYSGLGGIENAKGLNFMMMVMAFGFLFSYFLRFDSLGRPIAFLGSALLVINPVFIVQSFSFYLDGQLYFALVSLGALLGIFLMVHKNHLVVLTMMLMALLWNLKLIGIMASSIFIIGFLVISWYREKVLVSFKILLAFVFTGMASIIILGFNPYITNMKWFGHPLYPAYGRGATDYIRGNMPETFFDNNRIERLFLSVGSRSEMKRGFNTGHTLKTPFTYDWKEVQAFNVTNNTLGGFGPLFSGAGILSVLIIISIFLLRKNKKHFAEHRMIIFSIAVIFISCVAMPISSYARYVPQLWAIAPITMIYAFSVNKFFFRLLGVGLAIILIWNVSLVAYRYYPFTARASKNLSNELMELRDMSREKPLIVSFGDFRSNRVRFAEAGIRFQEVKELPCTQKKRVLIKTIPESLIQIC